MVQFSHSWHILLVLKAIVFSSKQVSWGPPACTILREQREQSQRMMRQSGVYREVLKGMQGTQPCIPYIFFMFGCQGINTCKVRCQNLPPQLSKIESLSTRTFLHNGGPIAVRGLDRNWRSLNNFFTLSTPLFFHDKHECRKHAKLRIPSLWRKQRNKNCSMLCIHTWNNENMFI